MCSRAGVGLASGQRVKRVVAVGGDRVAMKRGRLILNGRSVPEPYAQTCATDAPVASDCEFPRPIEVPRGTVYVLGDNRAFSEDSRFWGPVDVRYVLGRVRRP